MRSRWIGDRAVGALGLGTASLSLVEDADDAGSERLIELAIENGVSYLDTAAAYTRAGVAAHSERMIARVLKRTSADVMVGTKGGHYRDDAIWPVDGRPESIRANCIASLRALETACLDLYFLHKPDLEVDFEDTDDGDSFGDERESSSRGASSYPGLDAAPQSDRYMRARCWVSEE